MKRIWKLTFFRRLTAMVFQLDERDIAVHGLCKALGWKKRSNRELRGLKKIERGLLVPSGILWFVLSISCIVLSFILIKTQAFPLSELPYYVAPLLAVAGLSVVFQWWVNRSHVWTAIILVIAVILFVQAYDWAVQIPEFEAWVNNLVQFFGG